MAVRFLLLLRARTASTMEKFAQARVLVLLETALEQLLPQTIQLVFGEGCTEAAPAVVETNAGALGMMTHARK